MICLTPFDNRINIFSFSLFLSFLFFEQSNNEPIEYALWLQKYTAPSIDVHINVQKDSYEKDWKTAFVFRIVRWSLEGDRIKTCEVRSVVPYLFSITNWSLSKRGFYCLWFNEIDNEKSFCINHAHLDMSWFLFFKQLSLIIRKRIFSYVSVKWNKYFTRFFLFDDSSFFPFSFFDTYFSTFFHPIFFPSMFATQTMINILCMFHENEEEREGY